MKLRAFIRPTSTGIRLSKFVVAVFLLPSPTNQVLVGLRKALALALLLSAHAFCSLVLGSVAFAAPAADPAPAGTGYVEQVLWVPSARELVVAGWAASNRGNAFLTQVIINVGPVEVYRGRMEHSDRQDVVLATGRSDWLFSGFNVRVAIPSGITGLQPISARMRLGNGAEFQLGVADSVQAVDFPKAGIEPSWLAKAALFLAGALPLLAVVGAKRAADRSSSTGIAASLFGIAVAMSFVLLVAGGWTGSSITLGFDDSALAYQDGQPWVGKPQLIRSDEWQVITPLALSQAAHQPAFPVVNRNLGSDGMNMLVVGMTGMPVAHISALAKPATWGFFLFDLRRALAWCWWLPFFGCFGVVWLLVQRIFSIDWKLAAGLALTVAASPYSVVFSGWPAYTVFFPATALLAANAALRTSSWLKAAAAGVLLGLASAGFALVLYPAWQISLAYLVVPLGLAWFMVARRELSFGWPQVAAMAAAIAVAAVILLAWWFDAREAVAAIRSTVYPGQRSLEVGGDADRWFLIKGLLSPITMYRDASIIWGASDAGSVALFLVPAAACSLLRWWAARQIDAVGAVLWGYIAVVLYFMFVGFSPEWARATFCGSTTVYRLDLALGMAQVLVFAWLASPVQRGARTYKPARWLTAGVVAIAAAQVLLLYRLLPPSIMDVVPLSHALLIAAVVGLGAHLLMRGRHAGFFGVYGTVMLAASIPFNPLSVAPSEVVVDPVFSRAVDTLVRGKAEGHGIAVISERNWAMTATAIGLPVTNTVFYYPPTTLMHSLDPSGAQENLWNRYQRVLFTLAPSPSFLSSGATYRIDSPRLDGVLVTLSPAQFDFRLLKSVAVLASAEDSTALEKNPTLGVAHRTSSWTLFEVQP